MWGALVSLGSFKNALLGVGEMAQWLGTLTVPTEWNLGLELIPGIHKNARWVPQKLETKVPQNKSARKN